jgi:predicted secreted protein
MNRQRGKSDEIPHERPVEVVEREVFDVILADLPGAGYVWEPGEVPAGLTLLGQERTAPATGVVGASQRKAIRFLADRAGDYVLAFTLARPWEDTPTETRTIHVHVRPTNDTR